MRRLPIYLLIDTTGTMFGEKIQHVNSGINKLINTLKLMPEGGNCYINCITYAGTCFATKVITPLSCALDIQPISLDCQDGPRLLEQGLKLLIESYSNECILSTRDKIGDWKPILIWTIAGKPSRYDEELSSLITETCLKFRTIICYFEPLAREFPDVYKFEDSCWINKEDGDIEKFFEVIPEYINRYIHCFEIGHVFPSIEKMIATH